MHPSHTVKVHPQFPVEVHRNVEDILGHIKEKAPVYGYVQVTFLGGKVIQIEKRETFKP